MSAEAAPAASSLRFGDLVALTKPRLNSMAVFAVGAGWWSVAPDTSDLAALFLVCVASYLVAGGAAAINQSIEWKRDAQMRRTEDRPVASRRVSPRDARWFGIAAGVAGLIALVLVANVLTAILGLVCLLWYVAIYTPLKTRTTLNTLAGTIPGALPPVMGVAAGAGELSPVAWYLFAVLVVWQIPHFLSIAWLYREDYTRGGFAMLPCVPGGEASTARQVVIQSLLLLVLSLAAAPLQLAGPTYFWVALGLGVAFLAAGVWFAVRRTDAAARLLMRASLVYLLLLLAAFAIDSQVA